MSSLQGVLVIESPYFSVLIIELIIECPPFRVSLLGALTSGFFIRLSYYPVQGDAPVVHCKATGSASSILASLKPSLWLGQYIFCILFIIHERRGSRNMHVHHLQPTSVLLIIGYVALIV